MKTNRRSFIKSAGIMAGITCVTGTGICSCSMMEGVSNTPSIPASAIQVDGNQLIVLLDAANGLKEIGGKGKLAVNVNDANENLLKLIIVHPEKDIYKVFADKCTHGGRELNYKKDKKQFICSSFGHSKYDVNGKVTEGPAKDALKIFDSILSHNQLIIKI